MAKRSGKFYYKNEKDVMKFLGLNPVPGSGSGWVHKEDGESDTVMVQLKSTDASSYRIDMLDIKKLEYHASVSHKVPIFLVQFLKQDKLYAIVEVGNIDDLCNAFSINPIEKKEVLVPITEHCITEDRPKIKSSKKSRDSFYKQKEENYVRRKRRY